MRQLPAVIILVLALAPNLCSVEAAQDPYAVAQKIFDDCCVSCHGPKKQKGKLRLDSLEQINKGGKNGPVVVPGNSAESPIVQRISLPADDEDVMPAKGDTLTADQIAAIARWVDSLKPADQRQP
jgi:mono/diheme cytochrome c family protein